MKAIFYILYDTNDYTGTWVSSADGDIDTLYSSLSEYDSYGGGLLRYIEKWKDVVMNGENRKVTGQLEASKGNLPGAIGMVEGTANFAGSGDLSSNRLVLSDMNASDGDVMAYDATKGIWKPVAAGGAVTTDSTLTGDGTVGDPLSQAGGVGGPVRYPFSVRSGFPAGSATYAPIAQGGAIGSGGYDSADPTDPANFNMNFATPFPAGTFSKIFIYTAAGPGVGESISYELQIAGATPVDGPKVTFTNDPNDQVKFGSDSAHTASVAEDGLVSLLITPSGGATRGAFTGYVLFTPTP